MKHTGPQCGWNLFGSSLKEQNRVTSFGTCLKQFLQEYLFYPFYLNLPVIVRYSQHSVLYMSCNVQLRVKHSFFRFFLKVIFRTALLIFTHKSFGAKKHPIINTADDLISLSNCADALSTMKRIRVHISATAQPSAQCLSVCCFTPWQQISICRWLRCITPKLNLVFNLPQTDCWNTAEEIWWRETACVMKWLCVDLKVNYCRMIGLAVWCCCSVHKTQIIMRRHH